MTAKPLDGRQLDVLAVGAVAVDEVVVVETYPPANQKATVLERRRECGGLAATALVAAARLGAHCAYAGVLGRDELSGFVLDSMRREGIDIRHVVPRLGARPIRSFVVIARDTGTRNIFVDTSGFEGPDRRVPSESLVRQARVLLVDHFGVESMLRLARIARSAAVHVVGDFEGGTEQAGFDELLGLVDHLIVSADFARELSGATHPADAAEALWADSRETVVVTSGADGSWYRDRSGEVHHCPAVPVVVRDTTGCGDVFHGAYATGLAHGLDLPRRVQLATAAAALAAGAIGGQAGAPTSEMISALLAKGILP
jgi:sulfofructose kinase